MKAQCFSTLENLIINNDVNCLNKSVKALEYLKKILPKKEAKSSMIIDNILKNYSLKNNNINNVNNDKNINKLFLNNKFLELNWEIIYDDSSNITTNINQIKILLKIFYLNLNDLKVENLNIILNEKEFNNLLLEFNQLEKNF
jgi:hypothetical protein